MDSEPKAMNSELQIAFVAESSIASSRSRSAPISRADHFSLPITTTLQVAVVMEAFACNCPRLRPRYNCQEPQASGINFPSHLVTFQFKVAAAGVIDAEVLLHTLKLT